MDRHLAPPASVAERGALLAALALVALVAVVPLLAVAARVDATALAALAQPRTWQLLGRSLLLATSVTVAALAIGVPCGAVFARGRIPLRALLLGVHLLPLFLPPLFCALGWAQLLGGAPWYFGPVGAWGVLTLTFAPVITAATVVGVRSLDSSVEEAARLVARPARVMARILVPAAGPQILLGALVVFALCLAELGVPMFLRVDVYSSAVFARLGGVTFSPGEALVLGLPVLAVALLLTLAEGRLASAGALRLRLPSHEALELGPAAVLFALGAAAISAVPLAVLGAHGAPALGSLRQWVGSSLENSLLIAVVTAVLVTLLGVVLGHGLARGRASARAADVMLLFAFFAPSAVLGVGIVAAWNRPATAPIYGSVAILILAFAARYGLLAVRVFAAAVSQTSRSYEDAAAVAGARYPLRLGAIVVPMQRGALVAAFGLTLVFCLRDLETAALIYPPGGEPLTVRIFTLEANGPTRVIAALAVLHTLVTATVLAAGAWAFERSRR